MRVTIGITGKPYELSSRHWGSRSMPIIPAARLKVYKQYLAWAFCALRVNPKN